MRSADDFQDDGGTPGWRARHQTIDIYPTRWAAMRAHLKRNPWTVFCLFVVASMVPYAVFFGGLTLLMIYAAIFD